MRFYDLITPEGTKDYLFEDCLARREVECRLRSIFSAMGYSEVVTPGIEFFDVFNKNSSFIQQEDLYKLSDVITSYSIHYTKLYDYNARAGC